MGFPHNFLNCPSILSHLDGRDPDHSLFTSSLYFMSFGSLGVLSIFSLFNLSSPFSETHHHCHRPICAHVFPRSPSFLSWAPMASLSSHLHVFVSSHLPPSLHPPTLSLSPPFLPLSFCLDFCNSSVRAAVQIDQPLKAVLRVCWLCKYN